MSHVAMIKIEVHDLDALKAIGESLGMEFRPEQKTYHWYGHHVGDYPLPEGFTEADLGKCDTGALVVADGTKRTWTQNSALNGRDIPSTMRSYEIGVCKARNGRPGYVLLWDFWQGGMGLESVVGADGCKLTQGYATEIVLRRAKKLGYAAKQVKLEDGSVQLELVKKAGY